MLQTTQLCFFSIYRNGITVITCCYSEGTSMLDRWHIKNLGSQLKTPEERLVCYRVLNQHTPILIGQMVVSMAHVFSALLKKLPKVGLLDYCMAFKTISQTACISIQNHTNYVPIACKIPCFAKGLSTLILRKTLCRRSKLLLHTNHTTITFENTSEISRRVGGSAFSGRVLTPIANLSSINFIITAGTESSVARMVRRNILM